MAISVRSLLVTLLVPAQVMTDPAPTEFGAPTHVFENGPGSGETWNDRDSVMYAARAVSSRTIVVGSFTVTETVALHAMPSGASGSVVPVAPAIGVPFKNHCTVSACPTGAIGVTDNVSLPS